LFAPRERRNEKEGREEGRTLLHLRKRGEKKPARRKAVKKVVRKRWKKKEGGPRTLNDRGGNSDAALFVKGKHRKKKGPLDWKKGFLVSLGLGGGDRTTKRRAVDPISLKRRKRRNLPRMGESYRPRRRNGDRGGGGFIPRTCRKNSSAVGGSKQGLFSPAEKNKTVKRGGEKKTVPGRRVLMKVTFVRRGRGKIKGTLGEEVPYLYQR